MNSGSFHDGLAYAYIQGYFNEEYGYIDKNGKMVITVNKISAREAYKNFDFLKDFNEGLAAVKTNAQVGENVESTADEYGEHWGYIDKNGVVVIAPIFDLAKNFRNGIAEVKIGREFKYIDTEGNFIDFDNLVKANLNRGS
ncbi:WG repeat-containing protein [Heliorestis acidaminivorans]|uniref:WG repeat-containing protein n=1 Tax=Heliorestis acidaminivorans TaxID=553427 RepID=A0A6I0EZH6_9FIRM|nr:WG repeat-containing protein [Heliorestis acidaminivorans]KAB2952905.1 WG repeat-containing protein [Heliorestis acidaminivorans]